jgi:hypothetical protein
MTTRRGTTHRGDQERSIARRRRRRRRREGGGGRAVKSGVEWEIDIAHPWRTIGRRKGPSLRMHVSQEKIAAAQQHRTRI